MLSPVTVYPCTYRELLVLVLITMKWSGISLYLQGTLRLAVRIAQLTRYIPVPTGNSKTILQNISKPTVYPCTYRELF